MSVKVLPSVDRDISVVEQQSKGLLGHEVLVADLRTNKDDDKHSAKVVREDHNEEIDNGSNTKKDQVTKEKLTKTKDEISNPKVTSGKRDNRDNILDIDSKDKNSITTKHGLELPVYSLPKIIRNNEAEPYVVSKLESLNGIEADTTTESNQTGQSANSFNNQEVQRKLDIVDQSTNKVESANNVSINDPNSNINTIETRELADSYQYLDNNSFGTTLAASTSYLPTFHPATVPREVLPCIPQKVRKLRSFMPEGKKETRDLKTDIQRAAKTNVHILQSAAMDNERPYPSTNGEPIASPAGATQPVQGFSSLSKNVLSANNNVGFNPSLYQDNSIIVSNNVSKLAQGHGRKTLLPSKEIYERGAVEVAKTRTMASRNKLAQQKTSITLPGQTQGTNYI